MKEVSWNFLLIFSSFSPGESNSSQSFRVQVTSHTCSSDVSLIINPVWAVQQRWKGNAGGGVTPLQAMRAWRSLLRAAARLLLWTTLWERLLWEPTSCFLFEPWTLNASFSGCCFGQKIQRTSPRCHGAVSDGPQSHHPLVTHPPNCCCRSLCEDIPVFVRTCCPDPLSHQNICSKETNVFS